MFQTQSRMVLISRRLLQCRRGLLTCPRVSSVACTVSHRHGKREGSSNPEEVPVISVHRSSTPPTPALQWSEWVILRVQELLRTPHAQANKHHEVALFNSIHDSSSAWLPTNLKTQTDMLR